MTKYPIKMLLDEKKNPFFPVITTDSVLVNGTEQTAADLFADRYTKAEIDKIIADLGTLQRLCGKVDSIELLPNAARPGDTYIVTGVSGNSSEYMYIGDKWEELGPMVDLSGYDTSEEVDTKLSSLRDNVNETAEANSAEALKQAKQYTDTKAAALATDALTDAKAYTDDVVSQIGTVDMSNYYTKEQADESAETIADEKIVAIPINDLLHFKGHVDAIDDLPKSGQVSGEVIEPKTTLNDTMYQGFTQPSDTIRTKIQNQRNDGYEYYVGSNWGVINTNHPETIEGVMLFNQSGNTSYINIAVRVNASTTKPCKWTSVYDRNRSDIMKHIYYDDGTIPETGFTNRNLDIFQPAWIILMANGMSSLSVLSNITTPFKFKYWDKEQVTFVTNMSSSPGTLSHLNNQSIVAGGFIYNLGYKLFGFDENENPYWITTTESDIIENHVYTVGENKDLYRANEADQKWELLSASVSIEEVETLIDEKILGALEGSY